MIEAMRTLLVMCLLVAGCSSDPTPIDDTPLTGTVGGQSWTYATADTDAFLSQDGDYFAVFYAVAFTACGSEPSTAPHLIVSVPKTVGDFDFTTQRNMTFVLDGNQNLISFDGHVRVDEITATEVRGGLVGSYGSGDNEVNGTFTLTICP
jgi:hypothetical protein